MRIITTLLLFGCLTACTSPTMPPPVEVSISPTPSSVATINPFATPPPTPISPPIDFSLAIQEALAVSDGYILYGSYQWSSPENIALVYLDDVIIQDSNGNTIPFKYANPAGVVAPGNNSFPFALKISGKDYTFPLLISVQSIDVILKDTATFQFDAGVDPKVGDEWETNLDVPINAYHIFVHKIKLISGTTPTELGFAFTIWVGPNINITNLEIVDLNTTIKAYGGGGGDLTKPGEIEFGWVLDGYSPTGLKTFQISNLIIKIKDYEGWMIKWQP